MLLQNRSRIRHAFQGDNSDHQSFSDSFGEAAILALDFREGTRLKAESNTAKKLGLVENLQRIGHRVLSSWMRRIEASAGFGRR
jgi:hypothetical protein